VTASRPRAFLTLDQLPLFADDRDVARAIVGPDLEKIRHWLASVPSLEMSGLPKRHTVYGRYVPAVRQFYERQYGLAPTAVTADERHLERPWPTRRAGRPKNPVAEETHDEILAKLRDDPPRKRRSITRPDPPSAITPKDALLAKLEGRIAQEKAEKKATRGARRADRAREKLAAIAARRAAKSAAKPP
jgi:hypothetical protein